MHDDDKFAQLHKLSPLGRSSTPADVAATCASRSRTARSPALTLLVDGGQHLDGSSERDFSHM